MRIPLYSQYFPLYSQYSKIAVEILKSLMIELYRLIRTLGFFDLGGNSINSDLQLRHLRHREVK